MDKVIETLEELTQITATMPETRFQMALTMAITDLNRCRQLEAERDLYKRTFEEACHQFSFGDESDYERMRDAFLELVKKEGGSHETAR